MLSTLIKYVTGDKPRLRFKIAGMPGEMSAVAMEDAEQMLAAAGPRDRAVVLLAAEAGLRAGEIRGLQWGDVVGGQLTVRQALDNETNEVIAPKHNKARTVPMSPRVAAALAALPRRGLWVIASDDGRPADYDRAGGMLEAITGLYARVGLAKPAMPIHALRHTFGTVMARRVPLGVLQRLMGPQRGHNHDALRGRERGRQARGDHGGVRRAWATAPRKPGRRRRFPSRSESDPNGT